MPGHLVPLGKNHWKIIIEAGRDPSSGHRRRLTRNFTGNKRAAEVEMARLVNEFETGSYIEPSKMTLAEYLRWWLEAYDRVKLKPLTYDSYKMICDKHLIPALGALPLDKLHQMHIQDYQAKALAGGRADGKGALSNRTVQYHHRVLSKALSYAVQSKIINNNVAKDVQPPTPRKKEMHPLDAAGVQKLLDIAVNHPDYAIVYTNIYTGLRRGELLGLRWKDIDLTSKNKVAHVQQILEYTKERGHFYGPPKTKASKRSVPLSKGVVAVLKSHKKKQAKNCLKHGENYKDNGLVFCKEDGSPEVPDNVSRRFKNLANKAGFPEMNYHDLRHYVESGIMGSAQKSLGF